jgi:hypothetical protein
LASRKPNRLRLRAPVPCQLDWLWNLDLLPQVRHFIRLLQKNHPRHDDFHVAQSCVNSGNTSFAPMKGIFRSRRTREIISACKPAQLK